jgi:hypothetical protein
MSRTTASAVDKGPLTSAAIRDRGERVIIDGVCNSACTLVLGIVPRNRVCVTPRARLGFHMPYYDMAATDGVKIVSYAGTADFMSYYPEDLKDWLRRHGGGQHEEDQKWTGALGHCRPLPGRILINC